MDPEELNEEVETETPTVEVTVEEAPENPEPEQAVEVVEAPEQTVIVEADDPGVSHEEVDRWVQLEGWKAEIEHSILQLSREQGEAQAAAVTVAADVAEEVATDAFAEAEAAAPSTDGGAPAEHEEDSAPSSARVHPWFESRADRRARKSNN